jgi:hypothetical protein
MTCLFYLLLAAILATVPFIDAAWSTSRAIQRVPGVAVNRERLQRLSDRGARLNQQQNAESDLSSRPLQQAVPFTQRRAFLSTVASALTLLPLTAPIPAQAAAESGAPTADDFARIRQGYSQIVYLLDHFDEETTICREGGGGVCKRTADPIRRALGLRSTTDPLFQIEKVFSKAKYMDLDADKLDAFFTATEEWNSAMNMSNSMVSVAKPRVSFLPGSLGLTRNCC